MAEHSEWPNAWTKETKHFVFRTNTSPELLEYYSTLLETYYGLMNKRVGIKPKGEYKKIKMTVNIYKSREEFHELSEAGIGPGTAGYFWSYDNTLNFYHDYQEPAVSDWVGLHECTHLLTFLIDQEYRTQIWLNEGLADYFGSATLDVQTTKKGYKIKIEPGKLQTDRVLTVQQAIEDEKDVKLEELFFLTKRDFHSFQYAHAWSFVYFLNNYDKGKYAKGFNKLFKSLYTLEKGVPYTREDGYGKTGSAKVVTPEDVRDLLLKKIKVKDVNKLEMEWKTFIAEIPVDGPQARLKRGLRAVGQWEFEDALKDLDMAIEAGIVDPRAYWGRGRAKLWGGNPKGAVPDFQKAIELDPLSGSFRYSLSQALYISSKMSRDAEEGVAAARVQAGFAMELEPENERYREWFEEME